MLVIPHTASHGLLTWLQGKASTSRPRLLYFWCSATRSLYYSVRWQQIGGRQVDGWVSGLQLQQQHYVYTPAA